MPRSRNAEDEGVNASTDSQKKPANARKRSFLENPEHGLLLEAVFTSPEIVVDLVRSVEPPRENILDVRKAYVAHQSALKRVRDKVLEISDLPKIGKETAKKIDSLLHHLTEMCADERVVQGVAEFHDLHNYEDAEEFALHVKLLVEIELSELSPAERKVAPPFIDAVIYQPFFTSYEVVSLYSQGEELKLPDLERLKSSLPAAAVAEAALKELVTEGAPNIKWNNEQHQEYWVLIRPDDEPIGQLIADLRRFNPFRTNHQYGAPYQWIPVVCIGPRRSPTQIEMLRSCGFLYVDSEKFVTKKPTPPPTKRALPRKRMAAN